MVVETDRAARDALVTCLGFTGAEVHGAETSTEARRWLSSGAPDVVVLSEEAGAVLPIPGAVVVMLMRRAGVPDYPADEYLVRPVTVSRAVECIEALVDQHEMAAGSELRLRELRFDPHRRQASHGESTIRLGCTESRMLAHFMRNPHRVHSREHLLRRFWAGGIRVEPRTVDVYAGRIRRALRRLGCEAYLQTVRGSGYRFSDIA